jgi:hypothetical protein
MPSAMHHDAASVRVRHEFVFNGVSLKDVQYKTRTGGNQP